MLLAFGRAVARQAFVASSLSIRNTSRLTAPAIPSGFRVVAVFARGFAEARTPKKTTKTATSAKKKTAAKKPAKKAAAKKTAKKTTKPKAKAAKKSKTTRPKKPLTDEEKAKLKVRALKERALLKEQPPKLPVAPWSIFMLNKLKDALNQDPKPLFADTVRQLAAEYKALPEHEKEKLELEGQKNRTANEVTLRNWIDSYTVQQIREANVARSTLKRLHSVSVRPALPDPRFPKRPMTAYMAYVKSRYPAPEFEGMPNSARLAKMSTEWTNLKSEERKPYEEISETDSVRFKKEMDTYRDGIKKQRATA